MGASEKPKRAVKAHNKHVDNPSVYATIGCNNCGANWDVSFENTSYPPSEYAMAIEQLLFQPCAACNVKGLVLFDKSKLRLSQRVKL